MSRSFTSYSEGIVNILNESIGWVIYMIGLSMDGLDRCAKNSINACNILLYII